MEVMKKDQGVKANSTTEVIEIGRNPGLEEISNLGDKAKVKAEIDHSEGRIVDLEEIETHLEEETRPEVEAEILPEIEAGILTGEETMIPTEKEGDSPRTGGDLPANTEEQAHEEVLQMR